MSDVERILILGASGGIGGAVARASAGPGVQLILQGRARDKLVALGKELSESCRQVVVLPCDLQDEVSLQRLVKQISETAHVIDWIVQAAGHIDEREPDHEMTYADVATAFAVNAIAPIFLTQKLLDRLSGIGGVIIISSTAALSGNPGFPVYASSKGAINAYGQTLARRFERSENRAVVVCPAGTNTPMRQRVAGDADTQQSADAVAVHVRAIMTGENGVRNGEVVIIRNGNLSRA